MAVDSSVVASLSKDQCLLLATHFAAESDVASLRTLLSSRHDVLNSNLFLQCLLTYLPETVDPSSYIDIISAISRNEILEARDTSSVDCSSVRELSPSKARKRIKHLELIPLVHPVICPESEYPEPTVQFLIRRAHLIDQETGLLNLIPPLVTPFLKQYSSLRLWFISNVLPLTRLEYEYYPGIERIYTLEQVELADNERGLDIWLSKSLDKSISGKLNGEEIARNLRSLVAPWMCGASTRKRRRLNAGYSDLKHHRGSSFSVQKDEKISGDHDEPPIDMDGWDTAYNKLIETSKSELSAISEALNDWSGPLDLDLDEYAEDLDLDSKTELFVSNRFIQAAYSCIYSAEGNNKHTLSSAYTILCKIASLSNIKPLPGLQSQLNELDQMKAKASDFEEFESFKVDTDSLMQTINHLTTVGSKSFHLARYCIISAYLLDTLGHPITTSGTAKVRYMLEKEEQSAMFQKLVHYLANGKKPSRMEWPTIRGHLLWLWGWGQETTKSETGLGIFGKVDRKSIEKDILEALLTTSCYSDATNIYLDHDQGHSLSRTEIEQVIISTALQLYDNASNGNRTRGAMKKASDIVSTFSKFYPNSIQFRRLAALIAATHSMSSYSLTLQHGVPFQPVSIRVSSDPISLIEKILAQNSGSYVRLQDLVSIGTNFVLAGLTFHSHDDGPIQEPSPNELENAKLKAQRRVIGMAIEAALNEDDFETAYSYVVNWLDTSSSSAARTSTDSKRPSSRAGDPDQEDDIAWRAALAAGKHKSLSSSTTANAPPALRRLEQRMELLSQALLLAPPTALPEVLSAWRRCEEEMSILLAEETPEVESGLTTPSTLPGAFVESSLPSQLRREIGRGASEEAPMGLFDVARGAAAAFSKSAFPLRGAANASTSRSPTGSFEESGEDGDGTGKDRVRKRDMVANAVTGGLASSIGWVLGATPVNQPGPRQ